jgi:hypothetical protein
VNPSLADVQSVEQTVAVGCSLVRSALGKRLVIPMVDSDSMMLQARRCCEGVEYITVVPCRLGYDGNEIRFRSDGKHHG